MPIMKMFVDGQLDGSTIQTITRDYAYRIGRMLSNKLQMLTVLWRTKTRSSKWNSQGDESDLAFWFFLIKITEKFRWHLGIRYWI